MNTKMFVIVLVVVVGTFAVIITQQLCGSKQIVPVVSQKEVQISEDERLSYRVCTTLLAKPQFEEYLNVIVERRKLSLIESDKSKDVRAQLMKSLTDNMDTFNKFSQSVANIEEKDFRNEVIEATLTFRSIVGLIENPDQDTIANYANACKELTTKARNHATRMELLAPARYKKDVMDQEAQIMSTMSSEDKKKMASKLDQMAEDVKNGK